MIYEKLQKARVELQSKKLKKSGENSYSHFKYYELTDFLPHVNQIFYDLKLCSNFSIDENKAYLTVTDWEDKTQEVFTSPIEDLELKGCTKIQALGGIHTYMKRYLYLNALEIVENDMLDANAGKIEETTKKKQEIKDNDFVPDVIKSDKTQGLSLDKALEELKMYTSPKNAFNYFNKAMNLLNNDDKKAFRAEYQKYYNELTEGLKE